MTTLREAAQQALEALEVKRFTACGWRADCDKAITALRAALAEHFCDTHCTWSDHAPGCDKAEPVQEPVAWMDDSGHPKHIRHLQSVTERRLYGPLRPLYTTAPPQRKPLTEEEVGKVAAPYYGTMGFRVEAFARAIEQAHGIGEKA